MERIRTKSSLENCAIKAASVGCKKKYSGPLGDWPNSLDCTDIKTSVELAAIVQYSTMGGMKS